MNVLQCHEICISCYNIFVRSHFDMQIHFNIYITNPTAGLYRDNGYIYMFDILKDIFQMQYHTCIL